MNQEQPIIVDLKINISWPEKFDDYKWLTDADRTWTPRPIFVRSGTIAFQLERGYNQANVSIRNYSGVDFCVPTVGVITSICNTRIMDVGVKFCNPEMAVERRKRTPLMFGKAYVAMANPTGDSEGEAPEEQAKAGHDERSSCFFAKKKNAGQNEAKEQMLKQEE